MQPGDLATWVGVIVALLVGVGGVVVGWIGLGIARGARAEAKAANDIAKEANEVAKKANEFAAAALESSDVWWELQWEPFNPGQAILMNRGREVAKNLRGHVAVDKDVIEFGPLDLVRGAEGVPLLFTNVKVLLAVEETREHSKHESDRFRVPPLVIGYTDSHPPVHEVSWRVSWETPLGHTFHDKQRFTDQPLVPGTKQSGS